MTSPSDSEKIKLMRQGGYKLTKVLNILIQLIKPNTNFLDIEDQACKLIKKQGGQPSFKLVPGYNWATCLNVNESIVHGIPRNYRIKPKDLISLDIGMYYQGYHTDMCATFYINPNTQKNYQNKIYRFLQTGKKALNQAINAVKPGQRIGHISRAIQTTIENQGYNCARTLTGHGVGEQLHQEPMIPCVLKTDINQTPVLKKGMTLAIEVIYMMGKPDLFLDPDDRWTIYTKDGKLSAVFEKTVAVTDSGYQILTPGRY